MNGCGYKGCGVSTGVHEGLTFGMGYLDHNGFWSRPCFKCARLNDFGLKENRASIGRSMRVRGESKRAIRKYIARSEWLWFSGWPYPENEKDSGFWRMVVDYRRTMILKRLNDLLGCSTLNQFLGIFQEKENCEETNDHDVNKYTKVWEHGGLRLYELEVEHMQDFNMPAYKLFYTQNMNTHVLSIV